MRLAKILLGSAAMLIAGGATAAYADANPVVAAATVNPVASCGSGNTGWLKPGGTKSFDWCVTLTGSAKFTATLGRQFFVQPSTTDSLPTQPNAFWGDNPGDQIVAPSSVTDLTKPYDIDNLFKLTTALGLTATTMTAYGPVTISLPILGSGSPSLILGSWTFTDKSVKFADTVGNIDYSIMLSEPSGTGTDGVWWPDLTTTIGLGNADDSVQFKGTFNIGQRFWFLLGGVAPADPMLTYGGNGQLTLSLDPVTAVITSYFNHTFDDGYSHGIYTGGAALMGIGEYNQWGVSTSASFNAGSVGVTMTAAIDHMILDPLGARDLGNAFGFTGNASVTVGNGVKVNFGAAVGFNNGRYTGYRWRNQELGTYFQLKGGVQFAIGENITNAMTAEWNRGPVTGDGTIEIGDNWTFNPFGDVTNITVTGGINWSHAMTPNLLGETNALGGSLGVSVGF